jgi:hypothetical protein
MHNNVYDLSLDIGDEVVKEIHAPTIKRKTTILKSSSKL